MTRPKRPHDDELFDEGQMPADLNARLPANCVYAEYFQEVGDEVYPHGWWCVHIWRAQPGEENADGRAILLH